MWEWGGEGGRASCRAAAATMVAAAAAAAPPDSSSAAAAGCGGRMVSNPQLGSEGGREARGLL